MKDNINVKEKSEFKKVGRNGFKLWDLILKKQF
jgi:hypothetical protein